MRYLLTYKDKEGHIDSISDFEYYEQMFYFASVNGYEVIKAEVFEDD